MRLLTWLSSGSASPIRARIVPHGCTGDEHRDASGGSTSSSGSPSYRQAFRAGKGGSLRPAERILDHEERHYSGSQGLSRCQRSHEHPESDEWQGRYGGSRRLPQADRAPVHSKVGRRVCCAVSHPDEDLLLKSHDGAGQGIRPRHVPSGLSEEGRALCPAAIVA